MPRDRKQSHLALGINISFYWFVSALASDSVPIDVSRVMSSKAGCATVILHLSFFFLSIGLVSKVA